MLTTRDRIRIRYIIWKVRARCWLVERLMARAGRLARAGMSAAVAPDLLGFHCGPMFAAGLPIRREAEVAPNFSR